MPQGEYLQYGGQAIIEGVMMRSPRYFSVAVRAPNGEIVLQTEPLEKSWVNRQKWLRWPFFRGSLALIDAMGLGIRAMNFASSIQLGPQYQVDSAPDSGGNHRTTEGSRLVEPSESGGGSIRKIAVGSSMVVGLGFGVLMFIFLPQILGQQFTHLGIHNNTALNIISGLLKFVIFLGYIYLISRLPDIKRVFQYHGAEHKAINTLEADQDLTMENCRKQTRLHPRCGTSFAIILLLIDFLVLIPVPRELFAHQPIVVNLAVRLLLNLLILPLLAGIAYELIRFAGKFRSSGFIMALFAPGLATQYLTTAEPDESQIEVALTALRACIEAEAGVHVPKGESAPPADETAESIA